MRYDRGPHIAGIIPPGRPEHTFGYSVVGLMSRYSAPDVGVDTNMLITWNADRKPTGITRPGGVVITNEYNAQGRLSC